MSEKEYIEYLISCGFNEREIETKIEERNILRDLYYKNEKEPREITSHAYRTSLKRMTKEVERFIGV